MFFWPDTACLGCFERGRWVATCVPPSRSANVSYGATVGASAAKSNLNRNPIKHKAFKNKVIQVLLMEGSQLIARGDSCKIGKTLWQFSFKSSYPDSGKLQLNLAFQEIVVCRRMSYASLQMTGRFPRSRKERKDSMILNLNKYPCKKLCFVSNATL